MRLLNSTPCLRLLLTAFAVTAVGCMFTPYDGEVVPTRFKPVDFNGYAENPGALVRGQIQRFDNSTWDPLFLTYASTVAEVDSTGKSWYPWSQTLPALPTRGVYWSPTTPGSSTTKIRASVGDTYAYTFTYPQFTCTVANLSKGYMAAANECGVSKNSLQLNAACDVNDVVAGVSKGCYDATTFTQLVDYPFDRSMEFSNGLQGVANNGTHWFFTSAHRTISDQLSRIGYAPVGNNLNNQPTYYGNPYAPGHKHFGDPVHYNGIVYVPLEVGDGNANETALGRFAATNLGYYPKLPLSADSPQLHAEFPWIAYNPKTGKFYSSAYTNATGLHEYTLTSTVLEYERTIPLSAPLNAIQGGEFSPNGRLYLVANTKSGIGGLISVDTSDPNRAVVLKSQLPTWDPGDDEELEGLTVWDLDGGQAPGIAGQLHVIMIQNEDGSNDDWYFKHFRANNKDKF